MQNSGWPELLPRLVNQKLEKYPSISPWFEILKINSDTYAILEPHHYEEAISFLIIGKERAVLLDTGMGISDIKNEVKNITWLPVIVINSHYHNDHVGGNYRFSEIWIFDDDLEVSALHAGIPADKMTYFLERPHHAHLLPTDFKRESYQIRPCQVTHRLKDGEVIDLGERSLQVIHTPGHSPGSVCLLESRDRILFTGDVYYPGMLFADNEDASFADYCQSIARLVGILPQVSFLCPAHNEAVNDKKAIIDLQSALHQIATGHAVATEREPGVLVFKFDHFSLMITRENLEKR